MDFTDKYLRLNQALDKAMVEYQQKFDALKDFDHKILSTIPNTDIEKIIKERTRLEVEEREAYMKRKDAERNCMNYLSRNKRK